MNGLGGRGTGLGTGGGRAGGGGGGGGGTVCPVVAKSDEHVFFNVHCTGSYFCQALRTGVAQPEVGCAQARILRDLWASWTCFWRPPKRSECCSRSFLLFSTWCSTWETLKRSLPEPDRSGAMRNIPEVSGVPGESGRVRLRESRRSRFSRRASAPETLWRAVLPAARASRASSSEASTGKLFRYLSCRAS